MIFFGSVRSGDAWMELVSIEIELMNFLGAVLFPSLFRGTRESVVFSASDFLVTLPACLLSELVKSSSYFSESTFEFYTMISTAFLKSSMSSFSILST